MKTVFARIALFNSPVALMGMTGIEPTAESGNYLAALLLAAYVLISGIALLLIDPKTAYRDIKRMENGIVRLLGL